MGCRTDSSIQTDQKDPCNADDQIDDPCPPGVAAKDPCDQVKVEEAG